MKRLIIMSLICCSGVFSLLAQQTPMFSQNMSNKFLINPAVAGGSGYTTVNLLSRQQYMGFENSPRTFALSAQTRLLNDSYIMKKLKPRKNASQASRFARVGLGANLFSDRNGIVSKTGLNLSYAYHINFRNRMQLSFGLSGSAFQYKLDDQGIPLTDLDDPVLLGNDKQFWVPDAATGVYLTNNRFYAGLSLTNLFGSYFKLGGDKLENFRTARHYNLIGGYQYDINNGFLIEPGILLRLTRFEVVSDIMAKLFYQDLYWLGVSYRTNKTMVAMAGLSLDIFYFGYAYDASLNSLSNYTSGSHELMLGIRFGDKNTRRLRWLRKDEVEYDM